MPYQCHDGLMHLGSGNNRAACSVCSGCAATTLSSCKPYKVTENVCLTNMLIRSWLQTIVLRHTLNGTAELANQLIGNLPALVTSPDWPPP